MVQQAVIIDFGLIFCQNTYILESDKPMILVCETQLEKLDAAVENPYLPSLLSVCERAVALMMNDPDYVRKQEILYILQQDKEDNETEVERLEVEIARLETAGHTTHNSSARKTTRRNYSALNGGGNAPLQKAKKDLSTAKEDLEPISADFESNKQSLKDWESQNIYKLEDFEIFGKHCLSDAKHYYKKLFITGEYKKLRKVFRGARVFDPIYVLENEWTILQMKELIELCCENLNYPEFSPEFIKNIKQEYTFLLHMYDTSTYENDEFNWETVEGAKEWSLTKDADLLKSTTTKRKTTILVDQQTEKQGFGIGKKTLSKELVEFGYGGRFIKQALSILEQLYD